MNMKISILPDELMLFSVRMSSKFSKGLALSVSLANVLAEIFILQYGFG